MKKFLYIAACVGLVGLMSGCANTGYTNNGFSLTNPFKNQPVRTKIRSWFQGDACSACNAPAGQPANCGTNVAPLCDSCGIQGGSVYPGNVVPGVQLYENPNLNAPLGNPIYNQGIENPAPIYSENGAQIQNGDFGTGVANELITPPSSFLN